MSSAVEVRAALIALLNAAPSSGSANAYSPDDIKTLSPLPEGGFTEVWLSARLTEGKRAGGESGSQAWRLITRNVALHNDSAEEMRRRTAARLNDVAITVGVVESTIITRAVSDDPIAPDDGWWSGTSEWLFYL